MISDVRQITVDEFFSHPSSDALLKEYGEECALVGMPKPNPNIEVYKQLEQSGLFKLFGAFNGDDMDGFLVFLISQNPHYSAVIGTIESIFTTKEARKSGAGTRLINTAKNLGKEYGAVGLFISAPAAGVFSKVLSGLGAKLTNNVFFWSLNE
jgi:GNAT superfamily N-acetyltransferase